ncbi:MAG: hypothetical protein WEA24_03910 [Gemmatimonadota bacterium]
MRTLPIAVLALTLPLAACGGDDDGTSPPSNFELVVIGSPTFIAAHSGQDIRAAVVRGGQVVATKQSKIAVSGDRGFGFTFPEVLENGANHEFHYWIDSNFGGGVVGGCDDPSIDHQWRVGLGTAASNKTITEVHRPAETSDVCATFD